MYNHIKSQKLMEMATSPKMQLFMTFMVIYFFIGNNISIYSIFAVIQSITSTVGGLLKTNKSNLHITQCFNPMKKEQRAC